MIFRNFLVGCLMAATIVVATSIEAEAQNNSTNVESGASLNWGPTPPEPRLFNGPDCNNFNQGNTCAVGIGNAYGGVLATAHLCGAPADRIARLRARVNLMITSRYDSRYDGEQARRELQTAYERRVREIGAFPSSQTCASAPRLLEYWEALAKLR